MHLRCCGSGSSGNSYALIADSGEILLIECGVHWKKILKMIDFQPTKVVGCVATHKHKDHLLSYKDLFMNGIAIYTNDETADHFEVISGEKMIGVPERIPFKAGGFQIVPFYLPHTTRDKETGKLISCPNFGFLLEREEMGRLLYMTDFEYCKYSFKNMRISHFLIECNHMDDMLNRDSAKYEHSIRGHSSLSTVKAIIEANKTPDLRNIILCHLSGDSADPDEMLLQVKEVAGKRVDVAVAHAGMEPIKLSRFPF